MSKFFGLIFEWLSKGAFNNQLIYTTKYPARIGKMTV
jgi:hypothetical protein